MKSFWPAFYRAIKNKENVLKIVRYKGEKERLLALHEAEKQPITDRWGGKQCGDGKVKNNNKV